jgi:hypothetical protein
VNRSNGFRAATVVPVILTAFLTAAFFSACVNESEKTAGVDEFPNSIYARVNGFLDEGKQAEAINPVPALADSVLVQGGFNVAAGKSAATAAKIAAGEFAAAGADAGPMHGLAKAAADTGCSGTITVTDTVKTPLKTTASTASICVDARFLDTIKGNETVIRGRTVTTYNSGRVETADISDADGDGKLNPVDENSKANILFTATEKGVVEKSSLLVGPGPDVNFDTEPDNLIYAADWSKVSGADTLGTAVYTDADGDGAAIDNGKASLVDLDFYQKGPSADHPDAVWSRAQLRLVVRYQMEAKEVKRVRFEMEDAAGRREVGEVLNRSGGADFDMNDTVQAHFLTYATAATDTLDSMDVHLSMGLGKDFDAKSDDSIYAMDVRTTKKLGEEKSAHFSFQSDRPIPSGKDPVSGALSMDVEYTDGTSLTVDGVISATRLDVTVQDRQGKRVHAVWDRQGRGIRVDEVK